MNAAPSILLLSMQRKFSRAHFDIPFDLRAFISMIGFLFMKDFWKRNAKPFEMRCLSWFTRIHELNSIFLRQQFNWHDLKTSKRFFLTHCFCKQLKLVSQRRNLRISWVLCICLLVALEKNEIKSSFLQGKNIIFFKNMWNANRWFWCNGEKKTLLSAHFKLNDLKVINCEANVLMGKSISER